MTFAHLHRSTSERNDMDTIYMDAKQAALRWGCVMAIFEFMGKLHYCADGCHPKGVQIIAFVQSR